MEISQKKEFAKMLFALGEVFGTAVKPAMADAYFEALSEFDIRHLGLATKRLIRSSHYFPRPADFIAQIEPEMASARIIESTDAWRKFLDVISERRAYPKRGSKIDRAIESLGGMQRLKFMETRELSYMRKDFLSLYMAMLDLQEKEEIKALCQGKIVGALPSVG